MRICGICVLSVGLAFQIQACAARPAEADHDSPSAHAVSAAAVPAFGNHVVLLAHPYVRGEGARDEDERLGFDEEYKRKELLTLVRFAKRHGLPIFVLKSAEDQDPLIKAEDITRIIESDETTDLDRVLTEHGVSRMTVAGYISDALCAEITSWYTSGKGTFLVSNLVFSPDGHFWSIAEHLGAGFEHFGASSCFH